MGLNVRMTAASLVENRCSTAPGRHCSTALPFISSQLDPATFLRHMDTPSSVGPTANGPQSALIRATIALNSAGDGAVYWTCACKSPHA